MTEEQTNTNGFDLGPTIEFYERNKIILLARLPYVASKYTLQYNLEDIERASINPEEIESLIRLFPSEAIDRSALDTIMTFPPYWFSKESTGEKPIPTANIEEAISPTAIIPSYLADPSLPKSIVGLFELPKAQIQDAQVRRLIHSQGLVHEFVHSINATPRYESECKLRLPGGQIIIGQELLLEFGKMAEVYPAISQYAKAYRELDGTLKGNDKSSRLKSIDEELSETITAYLLGFVSCDEKDRTLNPLKGRPQIAEFIEDYLHARRVE